KILQPRRRQNGADDRARGAAQAALWQDFRLDRNRELPVVRRDRIAAAKYSQKKIFLFRDIQRAAVAPHFEMERRSREYRGLEVKRNGKSERIKAAAQIADACRHKDLEVLEVLDPVLHLRKSPGRNPLRISLRAPARKVIVGGGIQYRNAIL